MTKQNISKPLNFPKTLSEISDVVILPFEKPFEKLSVSTMTVMVYTNIIFDIPKLFSSIDITEIMLPLTGKGKSVDKKLLSAPYGSVVSVQSKTQLRGADIRKKKKHWCSVCQQYKMVNGREVKAKFITEFLVSSCIGKGVELAKNKVFNIMYRCSMCQQDYEPKKIKKIHHFLNQLTVILSIAKNPLLNIMMFKDNLKIVGCKSVDDAMEAILILWQDYIFPNKSLWSLKENEKVPKFEFDIVMKNVDFRLGFPIDRHSLNELMNREEYSDVVFMSQFESTTHTNVNIKMHSSKPVGFKYECLVVPIKDVYKPYIITTEELCYRNKKKVKDKKYTTLIVFSSSEIILTGRYDKVMRDIYNFFIDTIKKNKGEIEEILTAPNAFNIRDIKS